MGVDVIDIPGGDTGGLDGAAHRACTAQALGIRGDQVIAIGGQARAEQPCQWLGSPRERVLLGFQQKQRRGLAEDESVPVAVERPGGALGLVHARAERARHGEAGDRHRIDVPLDTTGDDHIGLTEHDGAPRVHERFVARGARRYRCDQPRTRADFESDHTGHTVGHTHRHRER